MPSFTHSLRITALVYCETRTTFYLMLDLLCTCLTHSFIQDDLVAMIHQALSPERFYYLITFLVG